MQEHGTFYKTNDRTRSVEEKRSGCVTNYNLEKPGKVNKR